MEKEKPVFIRERQPKHNKALALLEKQFGRDDFSVHAANRIGVTGSLLQELVNLGHVREFEGRFDLTVQIEKLTGSFAVPIPFYQPDSAFVEKHLKKPIQLVIESKVYKEAVKLAFARPAPEQPAKRPENWEPLKIFKRFRMPYSLYLLLIARFRNLSAYIRYLIYKDMGMEDKAEIEKARMGPRL